MKIIGNAHVGNAHVTTNIEGGTHTHARNIAHEAHMFQECVGAGLEAIHIVGAGTDIAAMSAN